MPRFSIPAAASFCLVGFDQSGRARKKKCHQGGSSQNRVDLGTASASHRTAVQWFSSHILTCRNLIRAKIPSSWMSQRAVEIGSAEL